MQFAQLALIPL